MDNLHTLRRNMDKPQAKRTRKPKAPHRQVDGYDGETVESGAKTSIYLPNDVMDQVKRFADADKVSVSHFVRSAVLVAIRSRMR